MRMLVIGLHMSNEHGLIQLFLDKYCVGCILKKLCLPAPKRSLQSLYSKCGKDGDREDAGWAAQITVSRDRISFCWQAEIGSLNPSIFAADDRQRRMLMENSAISMLAILTVHAGLTEVIASKQRPMPCHLNVCPR